MDSVTKFSALNNRGAKPSLNRTGASRPDFDPAMNRATTRMQNTRINQLSNFSNSKFSVPSAAAQPSAAAHTSQTDKTQTPQVIKANSQNKRRDLGKIPKDYIVLPPSKAKTDNNPIILSGSAADRQNNVSTLQNFRRTPQQPMTREQIPGTALLAGRNAISRPSHTKAHSTEQNSSQINSIVNSEQAAPATAAYASVFAKAQGNDRQYFDELAQAAAQRHGVDPHLVKAVITAESDYDPAVVSKAGAMGLMQLMPETASDLGVSDPFDPVQNVDGGTRYLAQMLERFSGDERKALAAYNWGPGNMERNPEKMPSETKNYMDKVQKFKKIYRQGVDTKV